ncbi:Odorant receptor 14 [Blattella germanica]|nr:Odorant receptor 14 [Blattella germanica]
MKTFYDIQLKMLHFTGILPLTDIYDITWKRVCYNIYTIIVIMLEIPAPFAQFVTIYQNWGVLEITTGVIFQVCFYFNNASIYMYLLFNRNRLRHATCSVARKFVEQFGLKELDIYDTIRKKAFAFNKVLLWVILLINSVTYFFWLIMPFTLWCTEYQNLNDVEEMNGYNTGQWRYFIYMTWVPQNALEYPIYNFIYLYQWFALSVILVLYYGYNLMLFSQIIDISSQFNALLVFLKEIDKMTLCMDNVLLQDDESNSKSTIFNKVSNMATTTHLAAANMNLKNIEEFTNSHIKERFDIMDDLYMDNIFTEPIIDNLNKKEKELYSYLINCIKFHQYILKRVEEINKVYSPILFVVFTIGMVMMCTTVFQVTVGSGQGTNMKLLTATITVWFPISLICYFGDKITQKSLEVQKVILSGQWYEKSIRFQKLMLILIMRAQKPVQLTGGKFFTASLETFSQVANKVYAYYTVLKQMKDSE